MNRCTLLALITLVALPCASAPAATVSGTLAGGAGYTVLSMAASGQSTSAKVAANGAFSVKVKGTGATLQLIGPRGRYFGPVVVGKAGKKAILGLSAKGGKLGRLALKGGYAKGKAPRKAISPKIAVRTTKSGAPLGAGRLGYVKMKGGKATARAAAADRPTPGSDPDGDGIPSAFDADDNGNGSLDGLDPVTARNAGDGLFSSVMVMMSRSLNANATGITQAAVDRFVKENTNLNFFFDGGYLKGATATAANVDCGALSYCDTGIIAGGGNAPGLGPVPWGTLDNDGDGHPDLPRNPNFGDDHGGVYSMSINPGATTDEIHAGDLYQMRFTTPGGVITVPSALSLLFITAPALASYDAGAGPQTVTYPATDQSVGTDQNPIMLTGDRLTLSFWRPQRAGLGAGEADYLDMGKLHYGTPMTSGSGNVEFGCPTSAYSGLSSTLSITGGSTGDKFDELFPLTDSAGDDAPDPSNLMRFTLDLAACLRSAGEPTTGGMVRIPLQAVGESRRGGTDRSSQTITVCLPGCTVPTQGTPSGSGPNGTPGGNNGPAPASGKPDLAIDGATGTTVGGPGCEITIQLANRGTAMSTPSKIRVQSGAVDTLFSANSVAAGSSIAVTGTIDGACGRAVTLTADAESTIDEYAEDNNVYGGSV